MSENRSNLTVFFESPFWVGVYERVCDGKLEVCKITFGAEPKDYEVYEFLLENWGNLRFSSLVNADTVSEIKINPKRMQRAIKKQLESHGVCTKSQQVLKLQQEEGKIARKRASHQQREAEQQWQFELRQQKQKDKHRGR